MHLFEIQSNGYENKTKKSDEINQKVTIKQQQKKEEFISI